MYAWFSCCNQGLQSKKKKMSKEVVREVTPSSIANTMDQKLFYKMDYTEDQHYLQMVK